jgi:hypothetical protein
MLVPTALPRVRPALSSLSRTHVASLDRSITAGVDSGAPRGEHQDPSGSEQLR